MNIGIFGATGSYDFGDYAMMIHNIQELYALDPKHTFTIFTLSKEVTNDNLEENIIDEDLLERIRVVDDNLIDNNISYNFGPKVYRKIYRILKKRDIRESYYEELYKNICENDYGNIGNEFLNTLMDVDLCIFNGGGYLQNSWQYHNIRFMAEIQLAKKIDKPVVFMSNSVGPMARYDRYTRETLPLVDYIMIRDGKQFSWKLMDDYCVTKKINGPDDLFDACDKYCENKLSSKDKYLMIEIMAWINRAPQGEKYVIKVLAQFINYLIEEENIKVRLINFDKWDVVAKKAISALTSMIKQPEKMKAMYEISNMYEVFEWYEGCCYSLSFKYHPVILALGAGKPCSAIITDNDGYYKSKLEGAFLNCNMDAKKHVIHINDLSFENLKKLYIVTKELVCDNKVKQNLYHIREEYLKSINNKELFEQWKVQEERKH